MSHNIHHGCHHKKKKSGENESSYGQGKSGIISVLVKVIEFNDYYHQILVVTEFFYIKRQPERWKGVTPI